MNESDPRDLVQGSEEWRLFRCGRLTSSRAADAFAKTKGGVWSASRANYRAELICERLSGVPYDGYSNWYMERGQRVEPEAVSAYELICGVEAQETGFWTHPTIAMFGSSPDRLVGDVGLLEAKARTTAIHFDLLLKQTIPTRDMVQVLSHLACNPERLWCDYVSYDPRAPVPSDLFVKRVWREEKLAEISQIERDAQQFLADVDYHFCALRARAEVGFIFTSQPEELTQQLERSIEIAKKPNVIHARKGNKIQLVK